MSLLRINPGVLMFACLVTPNVHAQSPTNKNQNPKPKIQNPKSLSGANVLATVEGEPITRREFTEFWLKVDNQASRPLGAALLERLRAGGSLKPAYTVSEKDLYRTLYSQPTETYATFLSNLVTNRLVAREAKRRGVVVTHAEADQAGRALLQQAREQQGLKLPDEAILTRFHVPRDLFLEEMTFRLRGERLLADSIARKNGHPLRADDWISLRELFAGANVGTDTQKNAQEFADAKTRVQKWAEEVRAGKPFADVAGARNEDETRSQGGLRGAALRGTGTQAVEDAVFQLKSGQMSAPMRTKDGWYIFLVERRGVQIPASERDAAWKAITEKRVTPYLAELRKRARITSVVPLPNDTVTAPPAAQAANK
jgi:hypothetical protein